MTKQTPGPVVHERLVALSHGESRYLEAGAGPPVLLLHGVGFAPAADSWRLALSALGTRFRVIAPDLLGWGPGDQLDIGYSFAYLVDFIRELQDALGLASSHVVGHSMGGWLASLLAYESPERVDSLVLMASGGLLTRPLPAMAAWQPPTEEAIATACAPLGARGVDTAPIVARFALLARDEARTERFRRVMMHMSEGETRARYNTERRLARLTCPTLVLWGDDDQINPMSAGVRTAGLVPGAELAIVEGGPHDLPLACPDDVHEAVAAFLR